MAAISKAIASDLKVLRDGPKTKWPVLREGGIWARLRRKLPFFSRRPYRFLDTYYVGTDPCEIDLNSWWGKIWLRFQSCEVVLAHSELIHHAFQSMLQLEAEPEFRPFPDDDPLVEEIYQAYRQAQAKIEVVSEDDATVARDFLNQSQERHVRSAHKRAIDRERERWEKAEWGKKRLVNAEISNFKERP